MSEKLEKDEQAWREQLTPEQYHVTRQGGTERAFTGKYYNHKESGMYRCVCCQAELFSSDTKFESGSGWPSFWQAHDGDSIELLRDGSHGMIRTEAQCKACGAHLGHVFDDGPQPSGQRFCINSASLDFDAGVLDLGGVAPGLGRPHWGQRFETVQGSLNPAEVPVHVQADCA